MVFLWSTFKVDAIKLHGLLFFSQLDHFYTFAYVPLQIGLSIFEENKKFHIRPTIHNGENFLHLNYKCSRSKSRRFDGTVGWFSVGGRMCSLHSPGSIIHVKDAFIRRGRMIVLEMNVQISTNIITTYKHDDGAVCCFFFVFCSASMLCSVKKENNSLQDYCHFSGGLELVV
ncbi:hypothetical protein T4C_14042 [Trichinella pseudospiralis]|uniref:Uncharacterized protein n=1 Tax=Trichinella pseudospiralis TaxID=6337 RepID=A0A0V1JWY0_TRIPS|nr:hypothetical protein T4C_14042 [Trichinella pseudospiralis]